MAEPTENLTPPGGATPETKAPAADIQAELGKALAAERAAFLKQLKEVTGHDSFEALQEARLKEQGKLQELADAKTQEADTWKSRFQTSHISNALLAAAKDAVDPAVVSELLTRKAACDEHGRVTIDGKPVGEAVTQLLTDKPYLAKAQGGTGSGTPVTTTAPAAPAAAILSPLQRLNAARTGK